MKLLKNCLICIAIALVAEIFLFNIPFFATLTHKNLKIEDLGGYCISPNNEVAYVGAENIDTKCSNLYLDVEAIQQDGEQSPVDINIRITDEGNSLEYDLRNYRFYPGIEKEKYITIHTYGNIHSIVITLTPQNPCNLKLNGAILDAKIPFHFSIIRFAALTSILSLISVCLPVSPLWKKEWKKREKIVSVVVIVLVNILLFFILVRMGRAFLHPTWTYHAGYQNLAKAILSGKLSIDDGYEGYIELLKAMPNPYDTEYRHSIDPTFMSVWDWAYYKGHLYMYFGVVPVFLYYIPYRLLTHRDLPTWFAVFMSASFSIPGAFYLLYVIKKKFFNQISYLWYLILATFFANSLNLTVCMLKADFYYLPIVTALGFSLWGIGLLLSAIFFTKNNKLFFTTIKSFLGAFLLALTSGCRPQFLISIFIVLAFILPEIITLKEKKKDYLKQIPFIISPFVIVAIGVMAYNAARFDSPFDFGANYNLTTNDMTHRGFNLERALEGLYYYYIQPVNTSLIFPFVQPVIQYTEYIGKRVSEWIFGGSLMIYPLYLSFAFISVVYKELKNKKLLISTIVCLAFSIIVVVADSEMAGVLNRYFMDFLWLLMIPSYIIICQLVEKYKDSKGISALIISVLILGLFGLIYEFFVAVKTSGMLDDNPPVYYAMRSLMSLK